MKSLIEAVEVKNKLSTQDRKAINAALIKAGFDGNGRFRKVGDGLARLSEVINKFGLEPDEVFNAHRFGTDTGRASIHVAFSNKDDPFSPQEIRNSLLFITWAKLREEAFEMIAYLS